MKDKKEYILLQYLEEKNHAKLSELVEAFGWSEATVRRKLALLECQGFVNLFRGGVEIKNKDTQIRSFFYRTHQNAFEKKRIALEAIKLIKNGDVIFLDGSTSAFFIAEYLSEFTDIKVITNGVDTLSLLAKNNVCAYSTGGVVSGANSSALVGHYAEEMISSIEADIFFFSANSVRADGKVYDVVEEENVIRRKMFKNARKKVLLCDASKFDRESVYRLCSLSEVDYFITNKPIDGYFSSPVEAKIIQI